MVAHAGSATWDLNPGSGDWNTATNWATAGSQWPADIATFGLSSTTDVWISANTEVNSIIFTAAATNPYTITASTGFTLTISGAGISNNSGTTQNFVTAAGGQLFFTNSANAGSSTIFTNNAGTAGASAGITEFFNTSSAGNATFVTTGSSVNTGSFTGSQTLFTDNSTAANGTFINNGGASEHGLTEFHATSSAANGTFINKGSTVFNGAGGFTRFFDNSTAANGTFINEGSTANNGPFHGFGGHGAGITFFLQGSTAANGTFINNGGTVEGADGGSTQFAQTSSAANGTFTNNGGMVEGAEAGTTIFLSSSTGSHGIFTNNGGMIEGAEGGATIFRDSSTADSATLIASSGINGGGGGRIIFEDSSTGGTSRVEVFGSGSLDISAHQASGVTIGSIEGDGNAFLGAKTLAVGSNDLSTNFSGVIHDGGQNGGIGGSLTKTGTGTLILSGANTYTGSTNVERGVLQVDGSINSNTVVSWQWHARRYRNYQWQCHQHRQGQPRRWRCARNANRRRQLHAGAIRHSHDPNCRHERRTIQYSECFRKR